MGKIKLNENWLFHKGDLSLNGQPWWGFLKGGTCNQKGAGRWLDDEGWQQVNVPHDFVIDQNYVTTHHEGVEHGVPGMWTIGELNTNRGSRKGGIAWYRKHFRVEVPEEGRVYLEFEGVYRDCEVYVNDYFVGRQLSGYAGFYFDITDFVNETEGEDNLLAVKVDASGYEGWYYEGGGIYRNVWLRTCGAVHVENWGTFVQSQVDVKAKTARLTVQTELNNRAVSPRNVTVRSEIFSPEGKLAASEEQESGVLSSFQKKIMEQEISLTDVAVWSLESPHLYRLVTTIIDKEAVLDQYETVFGIRKIVFDKDLGFFLNDVPVKIKGVCCHQDYAGLGIALPKEIQTYRVNKLKEISVNGYRTSHHPASPDLLEACDENGMLVMEENRLLSSGQEDLNQMCAMVKRDRNHPSVVIWSLGNEEGRTQFSPLGGKIVKTMRQTLRTLDPTRPVTAGIVLWSWLKQAPEKLERILDTARELDVMGFNYSEKVWDEYRARHAFHPMIITESSSGGKTRNCYTEEKNKCRLNYASADGPVHQGVIDELKMTMERPHICGTFLWTGYDYYGEPVPFRWPAVSSQFGLLDLIGLKKDTAYYFKCWWDPSVQLHLVESWCARERGESLPVWLFTNCEEVELWVNEKSYGKQKVVPFEPVCFPAVIYEPGVLRACGWKNGKQVKEAQVQTPGHPFRVKLELHKNTLTAAPEDALVVTASIRDEEDRLIPYACNEVTFFVENGEVLGIANGDPMGHHGTKQPFLSCFQGYCQMIVKAKGTGELKITADSPGLQKEERIIQVL